MADVTTELLKTHLRQLRLPTMGRRVREAHAGHSFDQSGPSPSSCSGSPSWSLIPVLQKIHDRNKNQGRRFSGPEKTLDTYDLTDVPHISL